MAALFPRLSGQAFALRLQRVIAADAAHLRSAISAPLKDIGETYGTVAGNRVPFNMVADLQSQIRAISDRCGFPSQGFGDEARRTFDREVAILLNESMGISPHEAAQPGVWQYLTTAAVPDVVRWRFPGTAPEQATTESRFLAGRRNLLGRLWWRAYILKDQAAAAGTDPHRRLRLLGEDELVQLMERASMFGDRRLLRVTADRFLKFVEGNQGVARQTLMREAQKRILRIQALVFLQGLEESDVAAFVEDALRQSALPTVAATKESTA